MKDKKKIKLKRKIGKEGLPKHKKKQFKREQEKLINTLRKFSEDKLDIEIP